MHHAFDNYGDIQEALREHSPLHQVEAMPDIPYLILYARKDPFVAKEAHAEPLVAAMRQLGRKIDSKECPLMAHCSPMTYEDHRQTVDFILAHLKPMAQ
jgi:hypothetical protein